MKDALKKIVLALFVASAALASSLVAQSASKGAETKRTVVVSSGAAATVHAPQSVSTLAQYRERVRGAVAPLEEFAAFSERVYKYQKAGPEVWKKEGFNPDESLQWPTKERAAFERVRALLPLKEKVEWAGATVEVDNTWLHAALEGYRHAEGGDKRVQLLRATAERLRALDARLSELEHAAVGSLDKDAERGRLNAILRDREFNKQTQQGGALQRFIEQIVRWILDLFGSFAPVQPGASPRASRLVQIIVLALCLAVVVYVGWRLWSRRTRGIRSLKLKRGPRVVLGERLEADQTSADLLEAAERLARAGDLRGAIRKAYIALLCELGDRNVIRLAQHKTNRDYLQAVRRASPQKLYTEMLPLTFNFELHWYGLQDASETDWDDFRTRCRQALRTI
jgi:hypothetical protein